MFENPILSNMIPLNKMITGGTYKVDARNFGFAVWDGKQFHGKRFKCGDVFIDQELHYESDEKYGTVIPLEYIEQINFNIELTQELLNYLIMIQKTH